MKRHRPYLLSLFLRVACIEARDAHRRTVSDFEWNMLVRQLRLAEGRLGLKDAADVFQRAVGGGQTLVSALKGPPGSRPAVAPMTATDALGASERGPDAGPELGLSEFVEALLGLTVFVDPDPYAPLNAKVERFIVEKLKARDQGGKPKGGGRGKGAQRVKL